MCFTVCSDLLMCYNKMVTKKFFIVLLYSLIDEFSYYQYGYTMIKTNIAYVTRTIVKT